MKRPEEAEQVHGQEKQDTGSKASLWGQSIGFWQAGACQPCLNNGQAVNIDNNQKTIRDYNIRNLTQFITFSNQLPEF